MILCLKDEIIQIKNFLITYPLNVQVYGYKKKIKHHWWIFYKDLGAPPLWQKINLLAKIEWEYLKPTITFRYLSIANRATARKTRQILSDLLLSCDLFYHYTGSTVKQIKECGIAQCTVLPV